MPIIIDIRRHTTTSISGSDVDFNIFPAASELLWTDDGAGDVSCPTLFLRNGGISTFSDGDGKIHSPAEMAQVFEVTGLAKVVTEITYCGGYAPPGVGFQACTAEGVSMILTRFSPLNLEGALWAHEYGHLQGLWLPTSGGEGTDPLFLSYYKEATTRRRVTQSECNAIHGIN